ncbi:MAG TPA: DUF1992 domain-containing protein [Deltaproteobacteria bacterium]|nr:MAG: DUF1992 domain-containing protein [Deltaproteobacteria bacterium]HDM75666.1 DUF1992 domain-containing protein [Deltaproteobacteria bacterium]HEC30936.1 DUF1992 domain-containing protein [Deltaproteobacteria bacterium]
MGFFDCIHKIAEERIKEALDRGEFDNLPGAGKPIKFDDKHQVPEELRLAYKILKNASCLPPEIELKKEIQTVEELLEGIEDEQEKYRQIKKLNFLILKLNMARSVPVNMEEHQVYYEKIVDKITVKKKKK